MSLRSVSSDELLRRCLIYKINEMWDNGDLYKWEDKRWFKIFQNKHGLDGPLNIKNLPNGFFESLAEEINLVVQSKLSLPQKELSLYTISASLLKRFLGKNIDKSGFSIKKKSGLAIYTGFRQGYFHFNSWDDFVQFYKNYLIFWHTWERHSPNSQFLPKYSPTEELHLNQAQLSLHSKLPSSDIVHVVTLVINDVRYAEIPDYNQPSSSKAKFLIITILGVVIACLGAYWFFLSAPFLSKVQPDNVTLRVINYTPGENRASIHVAYDLGNYAAENVVIRGQRGDIYPTTYVRTAQRDTVSFMLSKPGAEIELVIDNQIIKKLKIYQETTGWIGWTNDIKGTIGAYHAACELIDNGVISYPYELVPDHYKQYYFTYLQNNQPYGVIGDHSVFETRMRLAHIPMDATCNEIRFYISGKELGTASMFELKGCEYWMAMGAGNTHIESAAIKGDRSAENTSRLSLFTHYAEEYQQWNIFKLVVNNQVATYYWNDKEFLSYPFEGNIGEINSLTINTKGSWAIDWMRLTDTESKKVYFEDFSDCAKIEREGKGRNRYEIFPITPKEQY